MSYPDDLERLAVLSGQGESVAAPMDGPSSVLAASAFESSLTPSRTGGFIATIWGFIDGRVFSAHGRDGVDQFHRSGDIDRSRGFYIGDPDGHLIEVGQTTTTRGWRPRS
jgi:hypothetical protein